MNKMTNYCLQVGFMVFFLDCMFLLFACDLLSCRIHTVPKVCESFRTVKNLEQNLLWSLHQMTVKRLKVYFEINVHY